MDSFLLLVIVGAAAGWLAGRIVRGYRLGLLGSIVVGVLGAILGGFIFELIGLPAESLFAIGVSALVGAVTLLYLFQFARKL